MIETGQRIYNMFHDTKKSNKYKSQEEVKKDRENRQINKEKKEEKNAVDPA